MLQIETRNILGYQKVIEATNPEVGLHCFIAIHNSVLGPSALGGLRIYPYENSDEALSDALKLARAMTYKSAIAECGLGGGKSVIIADPKTEKNRQLLLEFGKVLNELRGEYIVAEDIGSTVEDMTIIHTISPYVAALPLETSSGDPSRFTAWGVFRGIQAVAKHLWKSPDLKGRSILIQGLGSVGFKLANLLFWEGAELLFSDVDKRKLEKAYQQFGGHHYSSRRGSLNKVRRLYSLCDGGHHQRRDPFSTAMPSYCRICQQSAFKRRARKNFDGTRDSLRSRLYHQRRRGNQRFDRV